MNTMGLKTYLRRVSLWMRDNDGTMKSSLPLMLPPSRKMVAVTLSLMLFIAAFHLAESGITAKLKRLKKWCKDTLQSWKSKPNCEKQCENCGDYKVLGKSTLLILDKESLLQQKFATPIGKRLALTVVPSSWFQDERDYKKYRVFSSDGNRISVWDDNEFCVVKGVTKKEVQLSGDVHKTTVCLVVLSKDIPDGMVTTCFPTSSLIQPAHGMVIVVFQSTQEEVLDRRQDLGSYYGRIVTISDRTSKVSDQPSADIAPILQLDHVPQLVVGGSVLHEIHNKKFLFGISYTFSQIHEESRVIRVDTPQFIKWVVESAGENCLCKPNEEAKPEAT